MYAYQVDNKGFIVETYWDDGYSDLPKGLIKKQLPQPNFYRPKWTGGNWVEGATQEEIDKMTKAEPQPPTVEKRVSELENTILMLLEVL